MLSGRQALPLVGSSRGTEANGRGDWIRTSDLLNPIQVRYQAALRPDQIRYYHTRARGFNSRAVGANLA